MRLLIHDLKIKDFQELFPNSLEENIFITANFPRFLYKFAAQMGWQKDIKKNGLRRKDLFLKK
ncbi:MAG: hypothetical protein PHX70_12160 [Clostridium sp.]|nr:hypothetical protein [Clostridium sp.]